MNFGTWEQLVRGTGCPLCSPRPKAGTLGDWLETLSVSSLYLSGNQTYRTCFDPDPPWHDWVMNNTGPLAGNRAPRAATV